MRSVDQHRHAGRVALRDDARNRQHQRARRGDVVEHRQPRPRRQSGGNCVQHALFGGSGERQFRLNHPRAGPPDYVAHRVAHGAIDMGEDQHLVTRLQRQRPQHGVAASGRILQEGDVAPVRADQPAQCGGGVPQCPGEDAPHEMTGLALHALPPGLLDVEHCLRRGSERTMVDREPLRIEHPLVSACGTPGRLAHERLLARPGLCPHRGPGARPSRPAQDAATVDGGQMPS